MKGTEASLIRTELSSKARYQIFFLENYVACWILDKFLYCDPNLSFGICAWEFIKWNMMTLRHAIESVFYSTRNKFTAFPFFYYVQLSSTYNTRIFTRYVNTSKYVTKV